MRLMGYVRYSSSKQDDGYSIEAQRDAIERWASAHNHQVIRIYVDRAASAYRSIKKRTGFRRMIDAVVGGEADGVVVHKLDRFSRNQEDSIVYSAMLRRAGKRLYSVAEPMVGGDSPTDRLTEGMLRVLGEFYSATLAAETAKGTRAMARRGLWPGCVPLGYVRADDDSKRLVPDGVRADIIRAAFAEMATGNWTLTTWAAEARRRGYRSVKDNIISRSRWAATFRRRLYIGDIVWRDEIFAGVHEPLVAVDLFEQVQTILTERGNGKQRHFRFYLLRGLAWSAVYDTVMSGNTVRNRGGQEFRYYRARGIGSEHNAPCAEVEVGAARLLDTVRAVPVGEAVIDMANPLSFLAAVQNVGMVYRRLADDEQRQKLLRLVFGRGGIGVRADGSVFVHQLNDGFARGDQ